MMLDTPKFHEKRTVHTTDSFGGINHSPAACDGDIYDAKNISCEFFPALTSPKKRYIVSSVSNGSSSSSLGADDAVFCSAGTNFIYDGQTKGSITAGKKVYGTLADTVTIFPDKKYYSHGIHTFRYSNKKMIPCTDEYQFDTSVMLSGIGDEYPESGNDGDLFYVNGSNYIYQYSSNAWRTLEFADPLTKYTIEVDEFGSMDETYTWNRLSNGLYYIDTVGDDGGTGNTNLKFTFHRDGSPKSQNFGNLKVGDVVSVMGITLQSEEGSNMVEGLADGTVITDIGTSYITVKNTVGVTNFSGKQLTSFPKLEIRRMVPKLSCVTRVGDRLWGAYKNKIYACSPNQPLQWGCEMGINDALMLSPNVSEDIIGCADLGGLPVFFTESSIIKVLKVYYGYKVSVISAPSLSSKNINSLAYASGDLYYVSSDGIIRYNGTSAQKLDCNLDIQLKDLVGGSDGIKYYLSNSSYTYIYDPNTNTWSKESGGFYSFARLGSDIYGICVMYLSYYIVLIGKTDLDVPSQMQVSGYLPGNTDIYFAPFYEDTHEKKTFTRLFITSKAASQSTTSVYASFDGGSYKLIGTIQGNGKTTCSELPMIPNRADYMQLRLVANGSGFELISLSREFITHSNYN